MVVCTVNVLFIWVHVCNRPLFCISHHLTHWDTLTTTPRALIMIIRDKQIFSVFSVSTAWWELRSNFLWLRPRIAPPYKFTALLNDWMMGSNEAGDVWRILLSPPLPPSIPLFYFVTLSLSHRHTHAHSDTISFSLSYTHTYTNTPTSPEIEAATVSLNISAHMLIMSPFQCFITLC